MSGDMSMFCYNDEAGFKRGCMKFVHRISLIIFSVLVIAACGPNDNAPSPTLEQDPAFTVTPDPCIEPSLSAEVTKVHAITREFDDYAALASNTPRSQLVQVIPDLQRVLRDAEDHPAPACLLDLKKLQVKYMQTVVQTLLVFVSNGDVNLVASGIAQAREIHSQYDLEIVDVLGIAINLTPPITATLLATALPTEGTPTEILPTPIPIVTNNGSNDLNLRVAPDFNAAPTNVLALGQSTQALGRTADSQWILVQIPNQPEETAWVYASVVQLSVPIETLPVTKP
jgi:hypothetical protein